MSVSVLLLASGHSTRFGGINKLTLELTPGVTILEQSIRSILKSSIATQLIITVNGETEPRVNVLLKRLALTAKVVTGGIERTDSVRNGLAACEGDYVLIHDAARPFASKDLFNRVLNGIEEDKCAIPVIPIVDTLYQIDESSKVFAVADRASLVAVQTPQGFPLDKIRDAHDKAKDDGTNYADDGSLFLYQGYDVAIVVGEKSNMKITYPADLEVARVLAIKSGILEGMHIVN